MAQKRPTTTPSMILGLSHCQLQALSKKSSILQSSIEFLSFFFKKNIVNCPLRFLSEWKKNEFCFDLYH